MQVSIFIFFCEGSCTGTFQHLHGLVNHNYLRGRISHGLLQAASLRRIRFHDLRHTFASLLLQQGESLVYVKEQMGHSSIQLTMDLYGHLIPGGNKQAVDRLDQPVNVVAAPQPAATQPQQGRYAWKFVSPKPSDLPTDATKGFGVSAWPISELSMRKSQSRFSTKCISIQLT